MSNSIRADTVQLIAFPIYLQMAWVEKAASLILSKSSKPTSTQDAEVDSFVEWMKSSKSLTRPGVYVRMHSYAYFEVPVT